MRHVASSVLALSFLMATPALSQTQPSPKWPQHSLERPKPPVVTPGPYPGPVSAPADAIVLFDGKTLDNWQSSDSAKSPARWKVEHGYFEVLPRTGGIQTKQSFGDVQLHIEWMSPNPPRGTSQDRGNSGVFFGGGRYEVQVLDSYQADTYADGQAGALYGQYPPLVNATRPPGEWQVYDIIYRRPHFDATGALTQPARLTVILNGIVVQDAMTLVGPTANKSRPPYTAHPDALPIALQDHSHPVRFRNVWVRALAEKAVE